MKLPVFEGKVGVFGDRGWVRMSFWMWLSRLHVTRVRWLTKEERSKKFRLQ